jgi:hypothetical protein
LEHAIKHLLQHNVVPHPCFHSGKQLHPPLPPQPKTPPPPSLPSYPHPAGSQRLGLLCLGELGRRTDLTSQPKAAAAVQAALDSSVEDIKAAASIALGGLTCGNLGSYLPSLLQQVAAAGTPKQQYLLLQALNEAVATISSSSAEGGQLTLSQGG